MAIESIGQLIHRVKTYLPNVNEKRLRDAYRFAEEAHKGQTRLDGSPYMTHPLAATFILMRFHLDEDALIACLLHDVPEDTNITIAMIEKKFGRIVAFLVDGVTKLTKVKYHNDMAERQVESLKKFFLHSAHDLRTIIIKLADRLHNMQTLEHFRPEKKERVARETLEIYVPIANLLGIWEIKSELEDLCFHILYPKECEQLKRRMAKLFSQNKKILPAMSRQLSVLFKQHGIQAKIESRPKSLFSIFVKMVQTGKRLEDMHDLLGLRIIVNKKDLCYRVLGLIHGLYRPKSNRIKDYITLPKRNGYQSLHTTVFGLNGFLTEFQIRTYEMHYDAEYGIAAHYFYKKKGRSSKKAPTMDQQSSWMQSILELQHEFKSNSEFLRHLKLDVFKNRIFVFTPRGDVVDLPEGAIGVDFAYHIHSDLGDHIVKLYQNGAETLPITVLKTGDNIEVITSKSQERPPREWLEKVKTNLAKRKIKEALKSETPLQAYKEGVRFMTNELHRYGYDEFSTLSAERKNLLIKNSPAKGWNEFLELVGNGTISKSYIVQTLYKERELLGQPHHSQSDYTPLSNIHYRKVNDDLITFQQTKSDAYYRVHLSIQTQNRVGLLRDIGILLAELNVNIYQIGIRSDKTMHEPYIDLAIEVVDLAQLQNAFDSIESISGVLNVVKMPKK